MLGHAEHASGDNRQIIDLAVRVSGDMEGVELLLRWLHHRAKSIVQLRWRQIESLASGIAGSGDPHRRGKLLISFGAKGRVNSLKEAVGQDGVASKHTIPLKNPTFAEIADFRGIRTVCATPKNSIAGILDDYF
jgi:hypothetical protein